MLSREEVLKLAKMARIALSDAEVEKFQKNLDAVLGYVDDLKQVDTSGLEEVSQVTGLINVQRDDKVVVEENREDIFSQAPEMKDGYFKVKAIL
ncbi:MAG: Asp-tRNA(Asn)/Glu-tRNA(Gln) amidotransferase subunit GatC [Candidatus Doudnabacteria bacterium]|nr:Asp-tRNA(Asn)/Glu-tRNA(Gln) amidotransferase subunit GatC [Candidatus Doudnabacteria bacterium]